MSKLPVVSATLLCYVTVSYMDCVCNPAYDKGMVLRCSPCVIYSYQYISTSDTTVTIVSIAIHLVYTLRNWGYC